MRMSGVIYLWVRYANGHTLVHPHLSTQCQTDLILLHVLFHGTYMLCIRTHSVAYRSRWCIKLNMCENVRWPWQFHASVSSGGSGRGSTLRKRTSGPCSTKRSKTPGAGTVASQGTTGKEFAVDLVSSVPHNAWVALLPAPGWFFWCSIVVWLLLVWSRYGQCRSTLVKTHVCTCLSAWWRWCYSAKKSQEVQSVLVLGSGQVGNGDKCSSSNACIVCMLGISMFRTICCPFSYCHIRYFLLPPAANTATQAAEPKAKAVLICGAFGMVFGGFYMYFATVTQEFG